MSVYVCLMCASTWVLLSRAWAILIIRRDSREGNYSIWNSGNKAKADLEICSANEAIALRESKQAHILFLTTETQALSTSQEDRKEDKRLLRNV